jgi:hypothetical protein
VAFPVLIPVMGAFSPCESSNAAGIWVSYIGKMFNFLIGSSRQFADMDTTVDVHLLMPMESGFL